MNPELQQEYPNASEDLARQSLVERKKIILEQMDWNVKERQLTTNIDTVNWHRMNISNLNDELLRINNLLK